jgi:type VI secretion system secreted protein Hcp
MAIYMKVPKAEGSVTAEGYKKWIELDSMQFGVGRMVTMDTGNMANRSVGLPAFSEITVSKNTDDSTFGLLQDALMAKEGKQIIMAVVEPGDDPTEYIKYELEDAIISSYSMSAGGGGRPSESISISYAKIVVSFTTHDRANKGGAVPRVSYDLAKGNKGGK